MINWPVMFRYAEGWSNGFWAGGAIATLIGIAGAAALVLARAI